MPCKLGWASTWYYSDKRRCHTKNNERAKERERVCAWVRKGERRKMDERKDRERERGLMKETFSLSFYLIFIHFIYSSIYSFTPSTPPFQRCICYYSCLKSHKHKNAGTELTRSLATTPHDPFNVQWLLTPRRSSGVLDTSAAYKYRVSFAYGQLSLSWCKLLEISRSRRMIDGLRW